MKKLIELTDEIMFLENDDFSKEQIKNEIRLLDEYQKKSYVLLLLINSNL